MSLTFFKKYVIDFLQETGINDSKPISTPMDYHVKGTKDDINYFNLRHYMKIDEILIYLTITHPDVSFEGVVSQHMSLLKKRQGIDVSPSKGLPVPDQKNLLLHLFLLARPIGRRSH